MLQEFGSEMEAKYRRQLGKFAKKKRQMFSSEEKSIFADIVADCCSVSDIQPQSPTLGGDSWLSLETTSKVTH